jgi:two-component system chemotaxis response regulator CheY
LKREIKALIVDDSKSVLLMMERMLKKMGISDSTKAGDGLQAAKLFEEALEEGEPYSLVFLDIVMPVMNGQEALKLIRTMERNAGVTRDKQATILMISSLHSPSDMIEALLYGDCADFLVKPFEFEDLREMLAKYNVVTSS